MDASALPFTEEDIIRFNQEVHETSDFLVDVASCEAEMLTLMQQFNAEGMICENGFEAIPITFVDENLGLVTVSFRASYFAGGAVARSLRFGIAQAAGSAESGFYVTQQLVGEPLQVLAISQDNKESLQVVDYRVSAITRNILGRLSAITRQYLQREDPGSA